LRINYRRLPVLPLIITGAAIALFALVQGTSVLTQAAPESTLTLSLCGHPPHRNCIVDGDTFYLGNQSIRVADIDAPETHPPRCAYEARLGEQATRRLRELVNAGPFTLQRYDSRDRDQYGRQLRVVIRDGRSLGAVLVSEGLARKWTGRRQPWCT
jgi:endonuclease YncB( thermonuclease family)